MTISLTQVRAKPNTWAGCDDCRVCLRRLYGARAPQHDNVAILRGGINPPLRRQVLVGTRGIAPVFMRESRCFCYVVVAAPLRHQVLVSERRGGINPPLHPRGFVAPIDTGLAVWYLRRIGSVAFI